MVDHCMVDICITGQFALSTCMSYRSVFLVYLCLTDHFSWSTCMFYILLFMHICQLHLTDHFSWFTYLSYRSLLGSTVMFYSFFHGPVCLAYMSYRPLCMVNLHALRSFLSLIFLISWSTFHRSLSLFTYMFCIPLFMVHIRTCLLVLLLITGQLQ